MDCVIQESSPLSENTLSLGSSCTSSTGIVVPWIRVCIKPPQAPRHAGTPSGENSVHRVGGQIFESVSRRLPFRTGNKPLCGKTHRNRNEVDSYLAPRPSLANRLYAPAAQS